MAIDYEEDVDLKSFVLIPNRSGVDTLDLRPHMVDNGGTLSHDLEQGGWEIEVTVLDPSGSIRRHPIFGKSGDEHLDAVDVQLDGVWFRLTEVDRNPDQTLTFRFMERAIDRIARQKKPIVTSRAKTTRRGFIVARAKRYVTWTYSPEINVKKDPLTPEEEEIANERDPDPELDDSGGKDLGTFESTAYGPPWGGIQGQGVTKGGTNLSGAPKKYIIAVDPTVLDMGKRYYVWPNPFDHKGSFLADDIGGAIKGKRIDFYDWRGRSTQNAWGRKNVRVSESANFASTDEDADPLVAQSYQFKVGEKQQDGTRMNWWESIQELSDTTRIRSFVDRDVFICMSETELARAKSVASLSDDNPEVNGMTWSFANGDEEKSMTVSLQCSRWAFPPGAAVVIHGEGKFDGRYIVVNKDRSLFAQDATITLRRPLKELPEPAHEVQAGGDDEFAEDAPDVEIDGDGTGLYPPLHGVTSTANGYNPPGHKGVDLICRGPNTIYAVCEAEVVDSRSGGWWGKGVTGDASRGDGVIRLKSLVDDGPLKKGTIIGYGHAEQPTVRVGERVKPGQVIGKAGFANAWHIHFFIGPPGSDARDGVVDPMPYYRAFERGTGKRSTPVQDRPPTTPGPNNQQRPN